MRACRASSIVLVVVPVLDSNLAEPRKTEDDEEDAGERDSDESRLAPLEAILVFRCGLDTTKSER